MGTVKSGKRLGCLVEVVSSVGRVRRNLEGLKAKPALSVVEKSSTAE
jgi:hypothetical protein